MYTTPLRRLARWFCLSCLCLLHSAAPVTRADENPSRLSQEKLDAITAMLQKAVDQKSIAGATALIAQRGKVIYSTSVGMQVAAGKALMTEGTIYRIASMSKPITSAAAMILVDEGKIRVSDPLSKFVPEFKEMQVLVPDKESKSYELVKAAREITIHDLLTHTSGISYRLMNKPFVGKMYVDAGVSDGLVETPGTIAENVRKLVKMPLVCQPGTAWEYGLNTDVLGYVVEVASGQTLAAFCQKRIFRPLRMNDTGFIVPVEKRSRLSALYSVGPDKTIVRVGDKPAVQEALIYSSTYCTNDESRYYSGGAGFVSTAGDYVRFCRMILNRGELDGVRVLKADSVDRMTRNQLGDLSIPFPGPGAMGYGFGVLTEQGKEAAKDPAPTGTYSWGGAFGTYFWVDPTNELIGVFMSQIYPPDFNLAVEFKRMTYEAIK
jgi:CubicO group peptidase (beta-lactamase class C family)